MTTRRLSPGKVRCLSHYLPYFWRTGGESPLPWEVPRDLTSGEKPPVVVGDSTFYVEDINGNWVETARSSMERPFQSHTVGVDAGHPAKGSDARHPATGSDTRHPCTGSDAGHSDKRSDAGHPGGSVSQGSDAQPQVGRRTDSAASDSVWTDGTGLTGRSVPAAGSRMAHAASG